MDWDKLRIFDAVAEAGSLTGAGQMLGMSQSAVSRQIATLESALGVTLFRRHARGLVLTEQGLLLRDTTKDMSSRLLLIKGQFMDTRRLPKGPVTVTVSEFIASTWLAPRLGDFREKYPDIQLTVLIDDRVVNLNTSEADAAIRLYKPRGSGLVQRHLASIRFHICGARVYFEKHGRPDKPEDLKNHNLLAFPDNVPGPYDRPNWIFDVANISAKQHENVLKMNSMYAIYRAVSEGAGIAVIPDYLIHANKDLEIVLPNLQRPEVDMYFIYAEERRNSKRINALRDFILEHIENTGF